MPEIFLRVALQNPQRPVLKANAAEFDAAACTRSVCWGNLRHSSPRQPHHPGDGNAENQEPRRKHHTARRLRPSPACPTLGVSVCRLRACLCWTVPASITDCTHATHDATSPLRTVWTGPPGVQKNGSNVNAELAGKLKMGRGGMMRVSTPSVEPIRAHMAPFSSNLCMVWLADSTMFRFWPLNLSRDTPVAIGGRNGCFGLAAQARIRHNDVCKVPESLVLLLSYSGSSLLDLLWALGLHVPCCLPKR